VRAGVYDATSRLYLLTTVCVLGAPHLSAVCPALVEGYAVWNATVENTVVTAQCTNGTYAFGNLQRRCLPTGSWTAATGVCNCTSAVQARKAQDPTLTHHSR